MRLPRSKRLTPLVFLALLTAACGEEAEDAACDCADGQCAEAACPLVVELPAACFPDGGTLRAVTGAGSTRVGADAPGTTCDGLASGESTTVQVAPAPQNARIPASWGVTCNGANFETGFCPVRFSPQPECETRSPNWTLALTLPDGSQLSWSDLPTNAPFAPCVLLLPGESLGWKATFRAGTFYQNTLAGCGESGGTLNVTLACN